MRPTAIPTTIPETRKIAGIGYAFTDDGLELPVIDVAHPSFKLEIDDDKLAELVKTALRDLERQAKLPKFAQSLFFRLFLGRSILVRTILASRGSYVSGMGTYLLKLGPDNLGEAYATKTDRRIASSMICLNARLRLRDIARLMSEGLAAPLAAGPGRTLCFINIGGGPSADSLNALMMLRRTCPESLEGRKVRIWVLDRDAGGAAFGSRALKALLGDGFPLQGIDASMLHVTYDWREPSAIAAFLDETGDGDEVVAISSEGGLFEYGSDEDIANNLVELRRGLPRGAILVGSLSRDDGDARLLNEASGAEIGIRLRSVGHFASLAEDAGWRIERVLDAPLSRSVMIRRSP